MIGRKEQSLGDLLKAEAPSQQNGDNGEVAALEQAAHAGDTAAARKLETMRSGNTVENKREMSFGDWDQKATQSGEWAAQKALQVKDKVKSSFSGLMSRVKKGVGWAMTAPKMAEQATVKGGEFVVEKAQQGASAVSEKFDSAANVDYSRNLNPDGGKMENFLASLDDKRDQAKENLAGAYQWSKEAASDTFDKYKKSFIKTNKQIDAVEAKAGKWINDNLDAGIAYMDNRVNNAVKKFNNFLTYHSPAQRRLRAREAAEQQLDSLKTVEAKNIVNVSAEDFMKLLKACEKTGVPVSGIRVEIGSSPDRYQPAKPAESMAAAA